MWMETLWRNMKYKKIWKFEEILQPNKNELKENGRALEKLNVREEIAIGNDLRDEVAKNWSFSISLK